MYLLHLRFPIPWSSHALMVQISPRGLLLLETVQKMFQSVFITCLNEGGLYKIAFLKTGRKIAFSYHLPYSKHTLCIAACFKNTSSMQCRQWVDLHLFSFSMATVR